MKLDGTERRELNAAMDRYADGDDAAFAKVYDLLAPRLLAHCIRRLGPRAPRALAEDIVQQTFLQIHAARHNYGTAEDVLPWAFAIARNLSIDAIRKSRKELLVQEPDDETEATVEVERASVPEEEATARETATRIRAVLARVPATQRCAYELVRQDGLSVADTAAVLGISQVAVKLRVFRVYEALRAVVGSDGPHQAKERTIAERKVAKRKLLSHVSPRDA